MPRPAPLSPGVLPPALVEQIEESAARVRVGFPWWLRLFVWSNVVAVTIGRRVYLAPRLSDRAEEAVQRIVRHELAHVRQVARLGLVRFLGMYVMEYIRLRRKGLGSHEAYAAISFEVEATEAEKD